MRSRRTGFTLVELLMVIAIISILGTIAFAGYGNLRSRTHLLECASRMRGLGHAVLLYATDHGGRFPASGHSGGSWSASVAAYLNEPSLSNVLDYRERELFSCPVLVAQSTAPGTARSWSYGLNVFFELSSELRYTPAGLPILGSRDSYRGAPATWHNLQDVPNPSQTVLLAENPHPVADHFMAHQWSSLAAARNAVASVRHEGKANYAFADGHVQTLPVETTFDPDTETNLWNPSLVH